MMAKVFHMHRAKDFLADGWQPMIRIPDLRPDEFMKGAFSNVRPPVPLRIKHKGTKSLLVFSEDGELIAMPEAIDALADMLLSSDVQCIPAYFCEEGWNW